MSNTEFMPGQRTVSLEQAFTLATEHHAAGRTQQAEALATQITQAQPRHAFAWQLLAVIAHEAGDTARGIELLGKAIKQHPLVASFYANRGEMHRLLGNLPQAVKDGEQAVLLDPKSAIAHSNLGIVCYHLGELERAKACQKQALRLDPKHLPAMNNLGSICRDQKDKPGAVALYRKILALRPDFLESANNLGAVLTEMEDPEAGLEVLLAVIRTRPNYAEAHCNIGNAFLILETFGNAEKAFNTAIKLLPGYSEAYEGLARCAQEQRNLVLAEQLAKQAIALKPRAAGYSLLGSIFAEQSFPEKAAAAYEQALGMDPVLVSAILGQGHLFMELGQMDAAEQCFEHALKLEPDSLTPRLSLTQVRKTKDGDANFAALQETAKTVGDMPDTKAISLHFAMGKALDDTKRYDEAFPHFLEACRLKRLRTQYSAENTTLLVNNIISTFSKDMINRLRGAGSSSDTPIFVLGMPRSGTTLTETIIASATNVYGAGELPDLLQIAGQLRGLLKEGYPLNMSNISGAELTQMGEQYISQLKQRAPEAQHITDKMPANFMAVGLIHLMLPNAKIVHVQRNPVDTCVSAFTKLFNKSLHQTYDLRELGRYYRDYQNLMAHWRKVLPADAFYEIQYEQLVSNQEEESRKLISYCGLDWSDDCLNPHKKERNIKTASIMQVRQPVYTSSVERWRVYEKFLGPLLEELQITA
jgi:tetratricopeptide (TPR) repeat protein